MVLEVYSCLQRILSGPRPMMLELLNITESTDKSRDRNSILFESIERRTLLTFRFASMLADVFETMWERIAEFIGTHHLVVVLSTPNEMSHILSQPYDQDALPPQFEVGKSYPPKGQWTLHRLASATGFTCSRCNKDKKAKLVAVGDNRWDTLCCNACYGLLLSKK